jgi:serine phosphatase RsbU (regulator of sigma subunit)
VISEGGPSASIAPIDAELEIREVLAAAGVGTWWWDAATGQVRWDRTLERLAGMPPGGFGGTYEAWLATLNPDAVGPILDEVNAAIESLGSYHFEHEVHWPDGSVHWLECRGQTVTDAAGAFAGTIGCAMDVTERHLVGRQRTEALASERRLLDRMEFLARLTQGALGASDLKEFMDSAAEAAVPKLGDWCAIHYLPENVATPLVAVAHSDPAKVEWARGLLERFPFDPEATAGAAAVIRTGRTELIEEVDDEVIDRALARMDGDVDEARQVIAELRPTSVMTVPLVTKRGVLGAMQFVSAETGHRYDPEDIVLAEVAAGQIAKALDNIWLSERSRHVSATLQRALLPPSLPPIGGVDVAVGYWPAGVGVEAGGDFYDIFTISPSAWSIVIGDVCGRGPDAAALTGIARHTTRAAARHGQGHREVLDWVNEAMRLSNRDRFCTAVYATLEEAEGGWRFTSCAAGHPRPIVVRSDGSAELLGEPGTLLGVFTDITVRPETTDLASGDVVVLYTDGLTDLPPPNNRTERDIVDLVRGLPRTGAAGVADAIRAFVSGSVGDEQMDDVALVVLQIADDGRGPDLHPEA